MMLRSVRAALKTPIVTILVSLASLCALSAGEFESDWPAGVERVWVGPQFWANRLQDWQIANGRLECVEAARQWPVRTVHLLTAALGPQAGSFEMSVNAGPMDAGRPSSKETWCGFLIGAGGEHVDYRLTALTHHRPAEDGGLLAVVDGLGQIRFFDFTGKKNAAPRAGLLGALGPDELPEIAATESTQGERAGQPVRDVILKLTVQPDGGKYSIKLSAVDSQSGEVISGASVSGIDPSQLDGGLALVSNRGPTGATQGYWFRQWKISGDKLVNHPKRENGPVLGEQYTLSRGVLKMTAQMPPLGAEDTKTARLEIRTDAASPWKLAATADLVPDSYTFPFRVENWDSSKAWQYRIVYNLVNGPKSSEPTAWEGTVRAEPGSDKPFVLAAFTGHRIFTGGLHWNSNGIWFPHNELVAAVQTHNPDFLFFSGDQIYESDLTGVQREPIDDAILDYLDKWYRWCWAFRDLTRDIPSVSVPDDHDVYHGNVWGAGGRHAETQDDGGYTMEPRFVNMVQQTQTSHLPDPVDPTPVDQGIGVYYTDVDYGGISFAVIEDRKWKSSPTPTLPEGKVVNGWFQNQDYNPATQADVPGAVLLGKRQLKFLHDWSADWRDNIWMKVVLSQTVFANIATLPEESESDSVIAKLPHLAPDFYPSGDKLVADADSNGWPQTGRNKALEEMRRGFALHVAGDQHLGTLVQYGIDTWGDAGFGFCVPSVANVWPRRWFPPSPGKNPREGLPPYTGEYRDGFGNAISVYAVSNPVASGKEPSNLYDRAPGYGIVRFDRETREITIECWPRWVDPKEPGAQQYLGWPVTINQFDNYGREPVGYLPTIEVAGVDEPVVQLIDESNQEVIYTVRIAGNRFRPKVFKPGAYTLKVGQPGTRRTKTLTGLRPSKDEQAVLSVDLQ